MTDQERFNAAKSCLDLPHCRYNIGTYKERTQHLLLKLFFEPDVSNHEVSIDGYIADILNDHGITEIQTAGFRALHGKLAVFLPKVPVRIVYPVALKKRTRWVDPDSGEATDGRYATYPKAVFRILSELLAIIDYFGEPGLSVEVIMLASSQYKLLDGYGPDRKRRATKIDTVPEELLNRIVLRNADDVRGMLPFTAGERITSGDISSRLALKRMALWRAVKFLTITEIIAPVDKKGNSIIYKVMPSEAAME